MALAVTYSRAAVGIEAPLVTVETHLSSGLPAFTLVGLPETAVRESRDRVRSAILNSHFDFPDRRITINLAPAELPKEGTRFDLAIAIGILAASKQIPAAALADYEFIGELALSGELRYVSGLLSAMILHGQNSPSGRSRKLIIPEDNASEASLPIRRESYLFKHILEVCAHLNGSQTKAAAERSKPVCNRAQTAALSDVRGQAQAKRALAIAAAGGHNLLFVGPPGTGKTLLASRLPSLLPPLAEQTAVEVAAIHSQAGAVVSNRDWRQRPFRSPHHTASAIALVGGGSNPKPGEISLAHGGVLFLDELPEFDRRVLEVLREPLESGSITISRARGQVDYPARFQLIAAMNPCPCGYLGDEQRGCRCSGQQIQRYRSKLSGPLLDRIDLQVAVSRLPVAELLQPAATSEQDSDAELIQRVAVAQDLQRQRQAKSNAALDPSELLDATIIERSALDWLMMASAKLSVSARAYHRIIRVARTCADLLGGEQAAKPVAVAHIKEALGFRQLS